MYLRSALIALVALALAPVGATAAPGDVWVNDDGTADPDPGGSCAQPDFNRIQDGVNAAPAGGRVLVCDGQYAEEVTIDKDLSLLGHGKPAIVPPAIPTDASDVALVEIRNAATVRVEHFVIGGEHASLPGCALGYRGVLIWEDATGIIEHNEIVDVTLPEALAGCQTGEAVRIGRFIEGSVSPGHGFIRTTRSPTTRRMV